MLVAAPFVLYLVWTFATYLFEGRLLTLARPEATDARLAYAVFVNLLIGVVGSGLTLVLVVRRYRMSAAQFGFKGWPRTVLSIALGGGLGAAALSLGDTLQMPGIVLLNTFAQVWVVSVAEVLVCWVLLATTIELALRRRLRRPLALVIVVSASAVAFGIYHFAHSPPFNTPSMVGLLTVVGLATGMFYLSVGELYGTIVFHNFLALKGVSAALAAQGRLDPYLVIQWPLLLTALVSTALLIAADWSTRRAQTSQ